MGYHIARFLIWSGLHLVARIEVHGKENVPRTGAFIVAANHLGRLDVLLVYALLNRKDIILMVAEKYKNYRIWRWLARQMNAMFVDRFNADFQVLRTTLQRLKKGEVLALAPEGTRSPTGALIEGRSGTAYLAARAGVALLPTAVTGTRDRQVLEHLRRLRRPKVTVTIGKAMFLAPLPAAGEREARLQADTTEIMCQIAALLPPEYRGVYAEHPRLEELLAAP